jgi:hypothetical protein
MISFVVVFCKIFDVDIIDYRCSLVSNIALD